MTRFWREGHWRTGPYGDDHWVDGHWVDRGQWDRASYSLDSRVGAVYRPRLTFESFTRPTNCPVCGADVFFVECANGGRVFFNELGWPWDKHPCTDSERYISAPRSKPPKVTTTGCYRWQVEKWTAIRIEKVFREEPWYVLKCKQLPSEQLVRALVPNDPGDLHHVPAMLSEWSADHFATLSYLDDYGQARELAVCKYSEYCLLEPGAVRFPPISATPD